MQRKQVRKRLANARALDDRIDKAVLEREFRRLEFLGQLLTNGVLNHAAASEADKRAGLEIITSPCIAKLAVTPPVVGR